MRKFIFETDWYTDVDDCVALRFLCRNLDEEHRLLGVNVNATTKYSYSSLKAFLAAEGLDVPVAVDEVLYPEEGRYQENMAKGSPYTNADAEETLAFYKRILEENDDVEIISVGFLNSLVKIYRAYPELCKSKIKKLWVMGGNWSKQGGKEYNFCANGGDSPALIASRYFVNEIETEIVFLGFEVGESVITGGNLSKDDILGKAMLDYQCPSGRSSWDPMTVLAAFDDKFPQAYGLVKGNARLNEQGENFFEQSEKGRHTYLVKTHEDEYYQTIINGCLTEKK